MKHTYHYQLRYLLPLTLLMVGLVCVIVYVIHPQTGMANSMASIIMTILISPTIIACYLVSDEFCNNLSIYMDVVLSLVAYYGIGLLCDLVLIKAHPAPKKRK